MPALPETPCVYVVDDDTDQRDGIGLMLRSAGFVSRLYNSAEAFLAAHSEEMTGCLVSDVRLPGRDGVGLIEALNGRGNRLPVIIISGFADTRIVVEAMRAGAVDFQEKPLDTGLLLESVRSVMRGGSTSATLRGEAMTARARLATLSARERAVFLAFSQGTSTKRIADQLGLSPKTVESHRTRMMEKLGLDSPSALVRLSVLMTIFSTAEIEAPSGIS
jgi:two-component system, LuxR family, response regulator FixJ